MIRLFLKKYWVQLLVVVVLVFLLLGALRKADSHGYSRAAAKYTEKLHELVQEQEKERAAAALEYSKVLQQRMREYVAAVSRADAIALALVKEKVNRTNEVRELRKEIANVTKDSTHVFSGEFVRLYNRSIGANTTSTMPRTSNTSGATSAARSGATTASRILPVNDDVTEADLLSHITYYGERCRQMEEQVQAWNTLVPRENKDNGRN